MKLKRPFLLLMSLAAVASAATAAYRAAVIRMGRQADGTFIVATGQRIEPGSVPFNGRPIDLAIHPDGALVAVLNKASVFLMTRMGIVEDSSASLTDGAAYRGILWNRDGKHLYASTSKGYVQELVMEGRKLELGRQLAMKPAGAKGNPEPGGMDISRDGKRLYVCAAGRNAVAEIDLPSGEWRREWRVQNVPFDVRLSRDEGVLIVSNWGGRPPQEGDEKAISQDVPIVVDARGAASSGTVSLVDRRSGQATHLEVGLHPSGLCVSGDYAYVANSASDSVTEINVPLRSVSRTIRIEWKGSKLLGSMPTALAVRGQTLYACNGGDNAVCEIDLAAGKVLGHRPAGFFPAGIVLSPDGASAYVVNAKGNGSVARILEGKPGNSHDFQGTVSVVDLKADLAAATARVAELNAWGAGAASRKPNLAVYNGAIEHVLYIIKENRTYDQFFGDLPQGDGDPQLCILGERVTPNHRALATEFTLFDNAYVNGTNSAEGHNWATQGLCTDYVERFYAGYSRSYPDDGDDPLALSPGGFLWDSAARKGRAVRVYGEMANDDDAEIIPKPASWLDTWKDRKAGGGKYRTVAHTRLNGLEKFLHPEVIWWPLLVSDQHRADQFIADYNRLSKENKVPNLMILALPCDHTEGTSPEYPVPRAMVADNDLALGRVVEAVSKSPQWKNTCIFVIEDDAQSGPDHVDGHRTVCLALSPYVRRKFVDSSFYTQLSILRSIELMLGLDPMTRFDATAAPFEACFTNQPDLTPFTARPARVALDEMNPPRAALRGRALDMANRSLRQDFSGPDRADPEELNRIIWFSATGGKPYMIGR